MTNNNFAKLPKSLEKPIDFTLTDEEEYEGLEINDYDFSNTAFTSLDFKDCLIKNCNLGHLKSVKLSLINVRLENCDLANLEIEELYTRGVDFEKCRLTGFVSSDSALNETSFKNCQLKLAQFRFTKMKSLVFDHCPLNEADFYAAQMAKVSFLDCDLAKAEMSKTLNFETDLRTSNIAGLNIGIDSLKGVIIGPEQINDLAWLLGVSIRY